MGLGQRKSKGSKGGHKTKNKEYKKGHATKNRRKDIDQIQDELMEEEEKGEETVFDVDDDLPGQGQFYCTPCARHFTDQQTKAVHIKSKLHKRRMKDVAQEQYTQAEAERGAGMSKEKYPPAHPVKGAPAASAAPAPGATKESRVESWAVPGGASGVGGVETAAKARPRGEAAGAGSGNGVSSVSVSVNASASVGMEEEDPDL